MTYLGKYAEDDKNFLENVGRYAHWHIVYTLV